ncbi:MAG: RHS repeat-associated core domain-containing protein [Bdellovibrionaceae bacterium]|nr:RHS repeat-associated core domain-containing protein [Pseudobdellovibrionaceae bacterium]
MIRGGQEYQFVKDHLGSVKLVVRVSDGNIIQALEYDEFGRVLSDTNSGFQPFGFAGGVYDAQTGLTKFGVRDYDAEVGRWLTKDPILFHGGDVNLYGYVLMDPVNSIDPLGMGPIGFGACAAIAAISGFSLLKDTANLKKQLDANRKEAATCDGLSERKLELDQEYLRLNHQYAKDQGFNQALGTAVGVACIGLIASPW